MGIEEFQIRGRRMSVSISGSGPVLLLVHGFPLDHTMWRHQIEYFSTSQRVFAPDLIGFGNSQVDDREIVTMKDYADDLADLIIQLNPESPVTFCGLSMGGYIGWQLLKFHSSLIDCVIMANTRSAGDDEKTARGRRLVAGQVIKHGVTEIASHMPLKLLGPDSQNLAEELRTVIGATDPQTVAAAQMGMSERPGMDWFLPSIRKPSLFICGSHDGITPPKEMQTVAKAVQSSQYVELETAGHMSPLEAPVEFNAAVASFLDSQH
jgi:pimeloyl-ACP methyl ester carboxylesterase